MVYDDVIFDSISLPSPRPAPYSDAAGSQSVDLWRQGLLSRTYLARSIFLDVSGRGFTLAIQGKIASGAELHALDYIEINTGKAEPVLHGNLPVEFSTSKQYVIINPPPFVRLTAYGAGLLKVYGSFSTEAYSQPASSNGAAGGVQEVAQLDPEYMQTTANLAVNGEPVDEVNPVPVSLVESAPVVIAGVARTVGELVATPFVEIPGIAAAAAHAAGDALGTMGKFEFDVNGNPLPKRGIIIGAKLIDRDDDTLGLTMHIFNTEFTPTADDAALALLAADAAKWVTSLGFPTFTDVGAFKVFEVIDVDVPYHALSGKLHFQCSTSGVPNIAAGAMPLVQLFILPLVEPA